MKKALRSSPLSDTGIRALKPLATDRINRESGLCTQRSSAGTARGALLTASVLPFTLVLSLPADTHGFVSTPLPQERAARDAVTTGVPSQATHAEAVSASHNVPYVELRKTTPSRLPPLESVPDSELRPLIEWTLDEIRDRSELGSAHTEMSELWSYLRVLQTREIAQARARFHQEVIRPLDQALDTIARAKSFLRSREESNGN